MPYQPVENTVLVELRYTLHGENVENTLHFHSEDGVTLANMQDLADFVDDWWDTSVRPLQSTAVTYRETYLTDLTTQTSPTYTSTVKSGLAGTDGSASGMPGNVTLCVSLRTNNRGRSGRGRNYFVGLNEDDVTGNFVVQAKADNIILAYENLLVPALFPYQLVVVSRQFNGVQRAEGLVQPVTNVLYTDLASDSMSRRLAGRGN